ncbi:MAG: sterol desaturase family protein [Burkholderiales bacterium]|nr:sterol desaturase family protein [Burkholderiales bacterium]
MPADTALGAEPLVRLGAFLGVFAAVALWEALAPRRARAFARRARWPHNLGLLLVDAAVLRVVAPGAAIAVALAAEARGWGLLHALDLPAWAAIALAVVLLDLAVYFQHVLFHAVPALWRLHRVHHADLDFDVTTGTRFHPVEILVSVAIKCAAVAAIGAPALAVLVFEVILNATAMFNHANAGLPAGVDRWLRRLVVTPDMHRVHHSARRDETNSNFGFSLPWWDRLFGTYRAQPAAGHQGMTIGLDAFRAPADLRLDRLLLQPLRERSGGYAVDHREEAR